MASGDVELALAQINFARTYTCRLLDCVPAELWFRQPTEGVTHVAWQVGHLAMAQYRLALERTRGPRPGDAELISDDFLALFGRDSAPDPAAERYPTPAELRAVFDRVHKEVMHELPELAEEGLDAPPVKPHSLCATKRACLFWCAQHELVHAGQIGLLRRLFGQAPVW